MDKLLNIALIGGNSKIASAIIRLIEKETDWKLHVYSSSLKKTGNGIPCLCEGLPIKFEKK